MHAVTKFTPFEIILGHLNKSTPFEMNENAIITDYVQHHKELTRQLYDNVKDKIVTSKERTISTRNQNREDPPPNSENETIYIKSREIRHKTKPKFKQSKVVRDQGPTLLTKHGHYHKNIIKRKRKITQTVPLQEPPKPPQTQKPQQAETPVQEPPQEAKVKEKKKNEKAIPSSSTSGSHGYNLRKCRTSDIRPKTGNKF